MLYGALEEFNTSRCLTSRSGGNCQVEIGVVNALRLVVRYSWMQRLRETHWGPTCSAGQNLVEKIKAPPEPAARLPFLLRDTHACSDRKMKSFGLS